MWTTGMHGYSRFSHQLNFQLTKADFPLALSPSCLWLQCVTVYSCVLSACWAEVAVWFGPPLPRKKKGGLLGQVWLQPCLWTASGQGTVCALSVQGMNGTCTRGKLWACSPCCFLRCHFGEGFLPRLPCWHLLCLSICIPVAEPGSCLRDSSRLKVTWLREGRNQNSDSFHCIATDPSARAKEGMLCAVGTFTATRRQACTGFRWTWNSDHHLLATFAFTLQSAYFIGPGQ